MSERLLSERLAELAAQVGGTPRLSKHDEDTYIAEITGPDGEHWSHEQDLLDPDDDAIAALVESMTESGWIVTLPEREEQRRHEYRLTFSGGSQATLKAHDAKEAVRLAGRGQPEEIVDLTEAEEMTRNTTLGLTPGGYEPGPG